MKVTIRVPSWLLGSCDVERAMREGRYNLVFHVDGDVDRNADNCSPDPRVSSITNRLFLKT